MKLYQVTQNNHNLPTLGIGDEWEVVDNPDAADMLVFWGGADVNPRMYGEIPNKFVADRTGMGRDQEEEKIYRRAVANKQAILGICRGSQFVTVMNGGKLAQHVDGHAEGREHLVYDIYGNEYSATSTHHQMMLPQGTEHLLVAWAYQANCFVDQFNRVMSFPDGWKDVETVWYPKTRTLAVQGHPEYHKEGTAFRRAVSQYMNEFLFKRN